MIVSGTGRKLTAGGFFLLAGCGLAKNGVAVAPRRAGADLSRYSQSRPSMGGLLTITLIAGPDRDAAVETAFGQAFDAVDVWEKRLSDWIPESPVSQINAAAGKAPVVVPDEVIAAFKRASSVSHASAGAFDLSYAGMDPTYASTLAIARRILARELAE